MLPERVRGELRLLMLENISRESVSEEGANPVIGIAKVEYYGSSRVKTGEDLRHEVGGCRVVVAAVAVQDGGASAARTLRDQKAEQSKVVCLKSLLHLLVVRVSAAVSDDPSEFRCQRLKRSRSSWFPAWPKNLSAKLLIEFRVKYAHRPLYPEPPFLGVSLELVQSVLIRRKPGSVKNCPVRQDPPNPPSPGAIVIFLLYLFNRGQANASESFDVIGPAAVLQEHGAEDLDAR